MDGSLNEAKECADVVGIFPNEAAIAHLTDAILEQSAEWVTQHAYYMALAIIGAVSGTASVRLPVVAA
jgi:hypothetical protein